MSGWPDLKQGWAYCAHSSGPCNTLVAALRQAGVTDQLSYVSMAGGAFLEWLEGRNLPGVAAVSNAGTVADRSRTITAVADILPAI